MIEIKNLSKRYEEHYAIKDISFTVGANESLTIIGPSGSGKSTILRCLSRLELPSSGEIFIDNKQVTPLSWPELRYNLGLVFQNFNLFPHFSVLENISYAPQKILAEPRDSAEKRAEELLEQFGLSHKTHVMPSSLSGGQKQRVAIARALIMKPKILLFDEPTSALDPESIKDIVEMILELKNNISVITVTHHLKFAKAIADNIIFMDQGQLLCNQASKDFFAKPKSHRARLFLENVADFM